MLLFSYLKAEQRNNFSEITESLQVFPITSESWEGNSAQYTAKTFNELRDQKQFKKKVTT